MVKLKRKEKKVPVIAVTGYKERNWVARFSMFISKDNIVLRIKNLQQTAKCK